MTHHLIIFFLKFLFQIFFKFFLLFFYFFDTQIGLLEDLNNFMLILKFLFFIHFLDDIFNLLSLVVIKSPVHASLPLMFNCEIKVSFGWFLPFLVQFLALFNIFKKFLCLRSNKFCFGSRLGVVIFSQLILNQLLLLLFRPLVSFDIYVVLLNSLSDLLLSIFFIILNLLKFCIPFLVISFQRSLPNFLIQFIVLPNLIILLLLSFNLTFLPVFSQMSLFLN